jgi:hypothetical protein
MATNTAPLSTAARSPSLNKQPKYYEADGALRAYANISVWGAVIAGVVALVAVAIMIFMRIQPPTVIRVLPTGEATVIGSDGSLRTTISPATLSAIAADQAPTAFEKENYVRTFLDRYLNYDAHSISANWSYALNMMTGNLRSLTLADFQKADTVGKYEAEHVRSVFKVSDVTNSPADPMLYTVTGVRTVNRMTGSQNEMVDEIVESYDVRLADFDRSPLNPAGLLIGQVTETQIHSETKQVMSTGLVDGEEQKQP